MAVCAGTRRFNQWHSKGRADFSIFIHHFSDMKCLGFVHLKHLPYPLNCCEEMQRFEVQITFVINQPLTQEVGKSLELEELKP